MASDDCGNGTYCSDGLRCSRTGKMCIERGVVDCGNYTCGNGLKCSSGDACIEQQEVDCRNGTYCPAGHICSRDGGECLTKADVEQRRRDEMERTAARIEELKELARLKEQERQLEVVRQKAEQERLRAEKQRKADEQRAEVARADAEKKAAEKKLSEERAAKAAKEAAIRQEQKRQAALFGTEIDSQTAKRALPYGLMAQDSYRTPNMLFSAYGYTRVQSWDDVLKGNCSPRGSGGPPLPGCSGERRYVSSA